MDQAWLDLDEREAPQKSDMEAALNLLPPGTPRLTNNTPKPERVRVPLVSVAPISLFHLLMVTPFLSPSKSWHMLYTKAREMGITQQVGPFMQWMGACTVAPPKRIDALTILDIADSTLKQRQDIRTRLVPPPPLPMQQMFHQPVGSYPLPAAPSPPSTPTKMPGTPVGRCGEDLRILLRLYNMTRKACQTDI